MYAMKLMDISLTLFSGNGDIPINNTYTNRTTDSTLSPAMKTYYSDYLIDLAEPELVPSHLVFILHIFIIVIYSRQDFIIVGQPCSAAAQTQHHDKY